MLLTIRFPLKLRTPIARPRGRLTAAASRVAVPETRRLRTEMPRTSGSPETMSWRAFSNPSTIASKMTHLQDTMFRRVSPLDSGTVECTLTR